MKLEFTGKMFCFTGMMSQLKRSHAEREVRSRLGLTQQIINNNLDYLVIGSIPSHGWKYGDYGNKIEKSTILIDNGNLKLKFISEHDFMEGLETYSPVSSGDLELRLLVIRYKSLVLLDYYDQASIELFLRKLQANGCHVIASLEYPNIYQDLYHQYQDTNLENMMYLNIRIVCPLSLDENGQDIMDAIAIEFEKIKGIDGDISFTEKKEGSASFNTLLKSIPEILNLSIT